MRSASSNVRLRGGRQGWRVGELLLPRRPLAAALGAGASWPVALLIAWDAAGIAFLVRVVSTIWRCDASGTERRAASEDDSRSAAEALLLAAGVASLIAVGFVLA